MATTAKRSSASAYASLVEKGCKCGTDRPQDCQLHGAGDNRGLKAFYKAGLPGAFPSAMTCGVCGAEGLGYPNVEIDNPKGSGQYKPTLVCPNCSSPVAEWRLRREAEAFGYKLNDLLMFPGGSTCSPGVRELQPLVDRLDADAIEALKTAWHATADGSNSTADFFSDGDGQIAYAEDGPKPSYALALLFDQERHMQGRPTALAWETE